jgi:capsular polysaccharide biosynthesis protein
VQIAEQAGASNHLTFTRWLAGIFLRWRLVVAVTVATVIIGLAATLIIPPIYRRHAAAMSLRQWLTKDEAKSFSIDSMFSRV